MILRGMQCGATALIVNVGIDLLIKQEEAPPADCHHCATFIANLFFDVNIMALIVIDGIIGFAFMRDSTTRGGTYHDISVTFLGIL